VHLLGDIRAGEIHDDSLRLGGRGHAKAALRIAVDVQQLSSDELGLESQI